MRILIIIIAALVTLSAEAQWQNLRPNENNGKTIMAIEFYDVQNGLIAEGTGLKRTVDNGNSWNPSLVPSVFGEFFDIEYVNSQHILVNAIRSGAVNYDKLIYESLDAGLSWDTILVQNNNTRYREMDIVNSTRVAMYDPFSSDSFLIKNLNGNMSMHQIQNGGMIRYLNFTSVDSALALICTTVDSVNYEGDVELMRSVDGGNSWSQVWTTYGNVHTASADFFNGQTGLVKVDSLLYSTADYGQNWTQLNLPSSAAWSSGGDRIEMVSPTKAFVFHTSQLFYVEPQVNLMVNVPIDSIGYLHNWVFSAFIDQDHFFMAENLLSCGFYGSNFWRYGFDENNPNAIDEVKFEDAISIYPNPTTNQLSIRIDETIGGVIDFFLYDMKGCKVLDRKMNVGYNEIDVSSLARSTYVIHMEQKGRVFQQKVLLR